LKCSPSCKQYIDKQGETFCWFHGTVVFKRQPRDIVDCSDLLEEVEYSDEFIANAVAVGILTWEEIAEILGTSRSKVARALRKVK